MKSSWDEEGVPDHERPLATRGQRALATMADYLKHRKGAAPRPDLILCSSALRTRQTLAGLIPAGRVWKNPPPALIEDGLYMATSDALVDRLRDLSSVPVTQPAVAAPDTVMLIGHNPGLETLALALADAPDDDLVARLAGKYPTGALARLDLAIDDWRDLRPGCGRLRQFITPRDVERG